MSYRDEVLDELREYASRLSLEAADMIDAYQYILSDIVNSLPKNRDWLNPDIEKQARKLIK